MTASTGLDNDMGTGPTQWGFANGTTVPPPESPYITTPSAYTFAATWSAGAAAAQQEMYDGYIELITWLKANGNIKTNDD